jgi:hypothetical protein
VSRCHYILAIIKSRISLDKPTVDVWRADHKRKFHGLALNRLALLVK